jgi:DNA-binding transcriptional LysR family regulator
MKTPRLLQRLAARWEGFTFCRKFQPSGTLKILELLDRGELDLAIGPHSEPGERCSYQLLLQDDFVVVLRKNHSATSTGELAIEKFADLPHLETSSAHHATDFIDGVLARRKLTRRITLRAPFLSAVRILASSDMVSVLPQRIAEELVRHRPLRPECCRFRPRSLKPR